MRLNELYDIKVLLEEYIELLTVFEKIQGIQNSRHLSCAKETLYKVEQAYKEIEMI